MVRPLGPPHDPQQFERFWQAFLEWQTVTRPRMFLAEFNRPSYFRRFMK
jgi:hypothetical protein